jgi:tetratricopeptide (TPR) repeat protein
VWQTGAAYFGPIDTFVSYTWRGEGITMANLVTSVQETLEADPLVTDINSVACFVDVFVCAQHRGVRPVSNSCPNATDVGKFEEVVNACTRLVLYCTPLANPKALTRVWCLYEIMSAIKRDRPVNVALSAADRAELHRLLYEDFDKLIALFSTIKSKQAEATFDTDRVMVFGWIKRDLGDNGFNILDQLVQVGMRQWLAEAALKLVRAREEAGEETEDTARLMAECGRLLTLLARYGEAEQLFRRALAMNERITGPDHINAAPILNCLGDLYRAQYRLQEAEPHYRKAAIMFLNAPTVGPNHWRTGLVIGELARTVKDLGRLDEADPLFRQSIAILAATRGPEHNDTATHMNNFAHLLMVKGQTTESAAMYRATLAILEKVHGPEHPSIGITVS